ncbi:MAG TPA: hypothetical protein ENJ54_03565 [Chloroflexi bacterium]|nr:hypothetical protein [Chloroflexota bacterium]
MSRRLNTWVWQALSGLLLVVLLAVHLIVNHFAAGGLLTYQQVVDYLSNPWVLTLEILFLATVIFHALAGVRALVLDSGVSAKTARGVTVALTLLGLLLFGYGLWLFAAIV